MRWSICGARAWNSVWMTSEWYNSLIQLQEGSFDEVKLDGNLVSQLMTNNRSREIVSGIIKMAGI